MSKIKIAVISVPEMGHLLPMVHIAQELTERGHDVTCILPEYNKEKCNKILGDSGVHGTYTPDGIS